MIQSTAYIENSEIDDTAKVYNHTRIISSKLEEHVVVADFARVLHSELGKHSRAERNNVINHSKIGRYTYFGMNSVVSQSTIGQFCSCSWGITIGPPEHDYTRVTSHEFLYSDKYNIRPANTPPAYNQYPKRTTIGNDVWIGADAVITNGITIGDGAVIGANTVVTKDVQPYAIVVGTPAKVIKYRFADNIIEELLKIKWWDLPIEFIQENYKLFEASEITTFILEIKKRLNGY